MIHIPSKDIANPPARLSVNRAQAQLRRVVQAGDGNLFTATYYPDPEVTALLRAFSLHKQALGPGDEPKCYYCECQVEEGLTLRVEHYRPKAKLDAQDNNGVDGPGYYWLGLEWTNLLLSCEKCNAKGAKGNRFPIRGQRHAPQLPIDLQQLYARVDCLAPNNPLITEEPLLLNPEIDDPSQYLTFDRLGYISAHGHDPDRGDVTWQILKLNRDSLIVKRSKILQKLIQRLQMHILTHQNGQITDDRLHGIFKDKALDLLERRKVRFAFTLWGRYINDHLQECLIDELPIGYRERFANAYQEMLNEMNIQPV